jgi:Uma2 family endonuclease
MLLYPERFLTDDITYPDSDGEPMADNTKQYEIMTTLKSGIEATFVDNDNDNANANDDVFVAGNLLWYPLEGDNKTRLAPDVMVAFGRPRGHRRSYMQWKEGGKPPQVVIEILSPGNRPGEMANKFAFYERFGVEEYLVYDPEELTLNLWRREQGSLQLLHNISGSGTTNGIKNGTAFGIQGSHQLYSIRLNLVFRIERGELVVVRADGSRFESFVELHKRARTVQQRAEYEQQRAEYEQQRAEAEQQRAEAEQQRADTEQQRADTEQQRADTEQQRADAERQRADRLAAQLRALGIDPATA